MKKLVIVFLLVIAGLSSRAQGTNNFSNNSGCDLQVRVICINESNCTTVSAGAWVDMPPGNNIGTVPTLSGACDAPYVAGYEVRYHPSTGCSSSVSFIPNPARPCAPTYEFTYQQLPPCSPCAPNGIDVWSNHGENFVVQGL